MTAKADRAQELIDDPLLNEAFENIRLLYLSMIEDLPLDEDKGKDALYDIRRMLHLLRAVKEDLGTMIQDGHLEDYRAAEDEREERLNGS